MHVPGKHLIAAAMAMAALLVPAAVCLGEPLSQKLLSRDDRVRWSALKELDGLDAASKERLVPDLVQALKSKRELVRYFASEALGKVGAPALPALGKALRDVDADVRYRASEALGAIGPAAVPVLSEALADKEGDVRSQAASGLAKVGPAARDAVSALVRALRDREPTVRQAVANALGRIGPAAKSAVPALLEALTDENSSVRSSAATALGQIGPQEREVTRALLAALEDESGYVRRDAVTALARMGPVSEDVVPALARMLSDRNCYAVRPAAADALGSIGVARPNVIAALVAALKDPSCQAVHLHAAEALAKLGPAARDAAPALVQAWRDEDLYVRKKAAAAIENIGPGAIPALTEALRDGDRTIRAGAAWQLGAFGPRAAGAVPAIVERLQDGDASVRSSAAQALEKIGTADARAALVAYRAQAASRHGAPAGPHDTGAARRYTKEEIVGEIPPDAEHRYAAKLEYAVPIKTSNERELLVTLHTGDARPDTLSVWKKIGDKYQVLKTLSEDPEDGSFGRVSSFSVRNEPFLYVPSLFNGTGGIMKEVIFWIAPDDTLHEIGFESARDAYTGQLKEGEAISKSAINRFSVDALQFELYIWNERDPNCCPTAGKVTGTYKLVGDRTYDPVTKKYGANFKVVVDQYRRSAIPPEER